MSSPTTTPDARAALLAAARAELEEHGVAALGLRAAARRAGLSHAAPGYFFRDRAGMLTALATSGWNELAEALESADDVPDGSSLARLGAAYVDFGLANAALYDLMTTADVLRPHDEELEAAQQRALDPLLRATGTGAGVPVDALMSWALVHGLVALARQHALPIDEADVRPAVDAVVARYAQLRGSDGRSSG